MKRILSLILALAVALSVVACGGTQGGPKVLSDTLAISKCDEEKITNGYTGLEFTLGDRWSVVDRDIICANYMKDLTGRQLEEMTADQLEQLSAIYDCAVTDARGNIVLTAIMNYRAENKTFEEYLSVFIGANTQDSYNVTDEKTVSLSGIEYKNITAYYEKNIVDICYKDRGDGHMAVVLSMLKTDCRPEYIHAFFNGGPDREISIENVPGLSTLDRDKWRISNETTGIEIDIPYGWSIYNRKTLAENQYFITEDQLNSMTAEDFAKLNEIYDIWLTDDEITTDIRISYVNRNSPAGYGLSAEDMQLIYQDRTNSAAAYTHISENVSFAGQNYYCTKVYYFNADITFIYLFREVNDDYIEKVMINADGDCNPNDILRIFDGNNDTDMLIKRSEAVEGKYQFHNRYSGVRINVLKDWVRNDTLVIDTIKYAGIQLDNLENWTDENYMNTVYIPDFSVTSQDGSTSLIVYYINLNLYKAEKPDIYQLYDEYVAAFEKQGKITAERDFIYPRGGRDYMVYKSTSADGTKRVQFATAEIGDDYAIMIFYFTPADSPVPDVTGLINDN